MFWVFGHKAFGFLAPQPGFKSASLSLEGKVLTHWTAREAPCMLFFMFFSIMVYHRIVTIVPVLYSRTLLFIHPLYNNLHLRIPNPRSFPPHPSSSLPATKSVRHMCFVVCICFAVYFVDRFICVIF